MVYGIEISPIYSKYKLTTQTKPEDNNSKTICIQILLASLYYIYYS